MKYMECHYEGCGNPVFSAGICRKHYERERLEKASPCSISGCDLKSYRGTLCSKHYREQIRATHPLCTVPGCTEHQKTLKSGLCEKHLFRYTRHNDIAQTRPSDWGAREQHTLYKTWHWHKSKAVRGMCAEWVDDFWKFVADVGERPDGCKLRKINPDIPLSPTNFEWHETIPSVDKAKYSREWRKANPDKAKNIDLKKRFGIGLAEYDALLEKQNKVCAICNQSENYVDSQGHIRMLAVDHCHKTKKIRGLLCSKCNTALGKFNDDPEILSNAIKYLSEHNADV